MTGAQFFKSFNFNIYDRNKHYYTDHSVNAGSPEHYIAEMLEGHVKIASAEKTLYFKNGDVFYIPQGLKYRSYWYPENGSVCFYSFGFDLFPNEENISYELQKIECDNESRRLLSALEENITVSPASIGRLYCFWGSICKRLKTASVSSDNAVINRALEYMRQNSGYTVQDIARSCGISESGLFTKFKKNLGKTPIRVKQEILTEKAIELLCTTDLTVEEISYRLGFSSPSYFRKVLNTHTGKTPTGFRKENMGI